MLETWRGCNKYVNLTILISTQSLIFKLKLISHCQNNHYFSWNQYIPSCVLRSNLYVFDLKTSIKSDFYHFIFFEQKPDDVNLLRPRIVVEAELGSENRPKRNFVLSVPWCREIPYDISDFWFQEDMALMLPCEEIVNYLDFILFVKTWYNWWCWWLMVLDIGASDGIDGGDCENFSPNLSVLWFFAVKRKQLSKKNLSYICNYLSLVIVDWLFMID